MKPIDYRQTTLETLLSWLDSGETTSVDLTEHSLSMIRQQDKSGPAWHAITWLFEKQAIECAKLSDARRQRQQKIGKLEGIPVLVKDNIDVAGWPTTAGSLALAGIVATEDAEIVAALRREGAIIIGKTAMHELAAGITGASSFSGFTQNALVPGYTAGGSSSGSAVAVAVGYVPLAIGTDTAGSVRIPASFNGVTGLRPETGTISLSGIVPLSPTQDTSGPLVRYASDLPRVMEILSGTKFPPLQDRIRAGYVAGWVEGENSVSIVVKTVLNSLTEKGVSLCRVEVEGLTEQVDAANVIAFEFAEALADDLAARTGARFLTLSDILTSGLYHPQLEKVFTTRAQHPGRTDKGYEEAKVRQEKLRKRLDALFTQQKINLLVYPVVGENPVRHGEMQSGSHGLLAAVTGMPALSLPVGFSKEGFPVGLELLVRRGQVPLLMHAAAHWQSLLNYPGLTTPHFLSPRR
ncbi:amidase [Pectobacterium cacticida]|uniref:Amidase n=1 Tax=Pectobacterium cacticida TaxID=69221 RepID=A0ABZ2G5C3_9GAMM|nr:amidase [Pectobacterium cacticida]UYX08509.1 amidase [Pectobacterium cacticida]